MFLNCATVDILQVHQSAINQLIWSALVLVRALLLGTLAMRVLLFTSRSLILCIHRLA